VLTLFSASNYCGRNRNKGAVAIFTHGQLAAKAHPEPELVQFEATQASADDRPLASSP
jgi:hypothetical protein